MVQADTETRLFEEFSVGSKVLQELSESPHRGRKLLKKLIEDPDEKKREQVLREVFDITTEVEMLAEIKDILDEITIILKVLSEQNKVLTAMATELKRLDAKLVPLQDDAASIYKQRHQMVEGNIRDFEKMMTHADLVYKEVSGQVAFRCGKS